jgi:hypothetical protein
MGTAPAIFFWYNGGKPRLWLGQVLSRFVEQRLDVHGSASAPHGPNQNIVSSTPFFHQFDAGEVTILLAKKKSAASDYHAG